MYTQSICSYAEMFKYTHPDMKPSTGNKCLLNARLISMKSSISLLYIALLYGKMIVTHYKLHIYADPFSQLDNSF